MKASLSKQVQNTLGRYVKRRQYTDTEVFKKSDLQLNQTLEEMSFNSTVQVSGLTSNIINYSSINGDPTAIEQQYNKLKSYIADASEPYKSELTHLLFPVFVNLYLELVNNGHKAAAQKFHARHGNLFMESNDYKIVVESLANVFDYQDIESLPEIKAFREYKYNIQVSEDCYEYFSRFLKNSDHLIILQVLNLCINIEIQSSHHLLSKFTSDDGIYPNNVITSPQKIKTESQTEKETKKEALAALKDIISKVRAGPPPLPSISLHTITNCNQGLSAISLNKENTLLACGFENSSIRLWSLTPELLVSKPSEVDVSKIRIACDVDNLGLGSTAEIEQDVPKEVKILRGHSGRVHGLEFLPKHILLSCSEDTTVRAWDLKTHTNVAIYRGHTYPVFDIDVSPLGLYFATASHDTTARLWTLDRTYPIRIMAGHSAQVDCVKFHPNCNYIATGSTDKTLRLWNIQDGQMVRMFQGHRGSIFAIAFSPNGQMMASAGEDRRIKIWDLSSGTSSKELRGHTDTVYSLSFNGDGSVLASSGLEHSLRLWDVRTGVSSQPGTSSEATNSSLDGHSSPELLSVYPTKQISIPYLKYCRYNLLMAVGVNVNVSPNSASSSS